MNTLERIRYHMKLRGWSEYRLAKESDLSQSTIANIFRRDTIPSIPTLECICNAFGLTLSQFFADSDDPDGADEGERELLMIWSTLSKEQQALVKQLIREMK